MTLRVRVLLGYGYLVALLLVAAISALLGFFQLSAGIDAVLEKNFASIHASMRMIESLERQDSATLAVLVEGRETAAEMESLEGDFLDALDAAERNVTEDEEPAILQAVRSSFGSYREIRGQLLSSRPERPLAAYDSQVFPAFSRAKADIVRLLEVNQRAMYRADREAKGLANQNGTWLGFLVAIALVSLVFLSRALQQDFLSRLAKLRDGIAVMAGGETRRRLHDDGDDELSTIARHVNTLVDRYERSEARFEGRLASERRLLLGLAAALQEGAAVYDPSGALVVGDDEPAARQRAIGAWIAEPGADRTAAGSDSATISVDGSEVQIRLLRAGPHPVGWLASPVRRR